MDKLKIALAGIGDQMIAQILPALRNLNHAHLVAMVTRSESKSKDFLESYQPTQVFDTIENLFSSTCEVDVVLCAAPPQFQEQVLKICADRGTPVFVEKPGILDAERMAKLQAELITKKAFLFTGYNFLYAANFTEYARMTTQSGCRLSETVRFFSNKPRQRMWALPNTSISLLYTIGVHAFSIAYARLGGSFDAVVLTKTVRGDKVTAIIAARRKGEELLIELSNGFPYFHWTCDFISAQSTHISLDNFRSITHGCVNPGSQLREKKTITSTPGLHLGFSFLGYENEIREMLQLVKTQDPAAIEQIHHRDLSILRACSQILGEFAK